jgi:hypothetical protein
MVNPAKRILMTTGSGVAPIKPDTELVAIGID